MNKQYSSGQREGCFAWLFRVKKSVNERLARVRNALRKKLSRENRLAKPLTPDDLENETGSPDLIISRILVSPSSKSSTGEIPSAIVTDEANSTVPRVYDYQGPKLQLGNKAYIGCALDGTPDPIQVTDFVKDIIASAEDEINVTQGILNVREDTVSLSSSILSVTDFVKDIIASAEDEINVTQGILNVREDTVSLSSSILSVTDFVKDIIASAEDEINVTQGILNVREDTVSLSSSILSAMANEAVKKSLTNTVHGLDVESNMAVIVDTNSLSSGALSVMANEAVKKSLTNIVHYLGVESNMAVIDDTNSLSSGALSDLAEVAVTESLTRIINGPDDATPSINNAAE